MFCDQELVSGGTTSTVLRNLNANTVYKVTLLPMYESDVEGKRQSENGKTSESRCLYLQFWDGELYEGSLLIVL